MRCQRLPLRLSALSVAVVGLAGGRLAGRLLVDALRATVGKPVGGAGHLVTQLEVVGEALRVEPATLDRRSHRAARLLQVPAVAEAADRKSVVAGKRES